MIELNFRPDERTLRQFGFIACIGFGVLGFLAFSERFIFSAGLGNARDPVAYGLWAIGGLATLFSFLAPKANWPIYVGLSLVSYPIGFVLSHVILGVLFFFLISPVALGFRSVSRDSMRRKLEPDIPSYWCDIQRERSKDSYFRQY